MMIFVMQLEQILLIILVYVTLELMYEKKVHAISIFIAGILFWKLVQSRFRFFKVTPTCIYWDFFYKLVRYFKVKPNEDQCFDDAILKIHDDMAFAS